MLMVEKPAIEVSDELTLRVSAARVDYHRNLNWSMALAKDFSSFEGSIPDSQDEYHIAGDGFVRLINFAVNHTELRPQHYPIVDQKLIPFLLAATKALGPGDYKLRCVGTASATGSFYGNVSPDGLWSRVACSERTWMRRVSRPQSCHALRKSVAGVRAEAPEMTAESQRKVYEGRGTSSDRQMPRTV